VSARARSWPPSGPARFVLEASFIVFVGVVAAVLDFRPLAIVIVMGLAWAVVALVERTAKPSRPRRARIAEPAPESPTEEEEEEPRPEPESQRRPGFAGSGQGDTATLLGEWNLWELERRARAHAGAEAVPEEWAAMFIYLREFAKSDGALPPQFDSLVRESFPELTRAG
jgi:hypothetical protein